VEVADMPTLGFQELLIIFLIIIVIFGASKIPQLGRGLGEGIRNFKKGLKEDEPNELQEGRSEESSPKGAS
jgi:sec-independent protein translocase protein TatA